MNGSKPIHHTANASHYVGEPIEFSGFADDDGVGVTGVEFSLDDGATWTRYDTSTAQQDKGVSWQFVFTSEKTGTYLLKVRALHEAHEKEHPSSLIASFPFVVVPRPMKFATTARLEKTDVFGSARVRAIGGGTLTTARLFRSCDLSRISEQEAIFLTRVLNIQSIYDIRSSREIASTPNPYLIGAKTIALEANAEGRRKNAKQRLAHGIIGEYGEPEERMTANYRRYVSEYPLIGAALRSIATESTNALIHCVNGKDRTGVLCAVALRIAGASPDDIMDDYLKTNIANAMSIAREAENLSEGMDAHERTILMSFLEARPAYLRAFFDEIDRQFGSFDTYKNAGLRLSPAQCSQLKTLLNR